MLAIKLHTHEWWVSAKHFERLFNEALAAGDIPPAFEEWLHVAMANGGLDFTQLDSQVAKRLNHGLRAAAQRQVASFQRHAPTTENGDYAQGLQNLLK